MNVRRMRWTLGALMVPVLALAAACGGNDDEEATPTPEGPVGQPTPTASSQAPQPLPSVTPVADDDPAIVITSRGGKTLNPTAREFREYATVTINGKSGPSVGGLSELAGARAEAFVTIQGRTPDGKAVAAWRGKLTEVATTTALVMDDKGIVSVVSSSIPAEQQLTAVEGISFE